MAQEGIMYNVDYIHLRTKSLVTQVFLVLAGIVLVSRMF